MSDDEVSVEYQDVYEIAFDTLSGTLKELLFSRAAIAQLQREKAALKTELVSLRQYTDDVSRGPDPA